MRKGLAIGLPLSMALGSDVASPVRSTACGITWDADDVIRFFKKCKWESQIEGFSDATPIIRRCLIWQGARSRGGAHRAAGRRVGNKQWYGSFRVKGKTVRAHKFAAVAIHGLRPGPNDEIDHNCYNTLCVFCLECVPKVVNQGRIRRGKGNAKGTVRPITSEGSTEGLLRHRDVARPSVPPGHQPGGGTPCC